MWHFSRCEDRISGAQLVPLVADLDYVFTFDNVEPLLLLMVEVPRYSALEGIDNLEDTEASVRIQSRTPCAASEIDLYRLGREPYLSSWLPPSRAHLSDQRCLASNCCFD